MSRFESQFNLQSLNDNDFFASSKRFLSSPLICDSSKSFDEVNTISDGISHHSTDESFSAELHSSTDLISMDRDQLIQSCLHASSRALELQQKLTAAQRLTVTLQAQCDSLRAQLSEAKSAAVAMRSQSRRLELEARDTTKAVRTSAPDTQHSGQQLLLYRLQTRRQEAEIERLKQKLVRSMERPRARTATMSSSGRLPSGDRRRWLPPLVDSVTATEDHSAIRRVRQNCSTVLTGLRMRTEQLLYDECCVSELLAQLIVCVAEHQPHCARVCQRPACPCVHVLARVEGGQRPLCDGAGLVSLRDAVQCLCTRLTRLAPLCGSSCQQNTSQPAVAGGGHSQLVEERAELALRERRLQEWQNALDEQRAAYQRSLLARLESCQGDNPSHDTQRHLVSVFEAHFDSVCPKSLLVDDGDPRPQDPVALEDPGQCAAVQCTRPDILVSTSFVDTIEEEI